MLMLDHCLNFEPPCFRWETPANWRSSTTPSRLRAQMISRHPATGDSFVFAQCAEADMHLSFHAFLLQCNAQAMQTFMHVVIHMLASQVILILHLVLYSYKALLAS